MKKFLLLFCTLSLFLASCGGNNDNKKDLITVKIGHVGESDRTIWKPVQEKLLNEGIKVELVSFADYTIPNQALNDGDIDLDAFQHHAYYSNEVNTKGYDLAILGVTYISAMNIYSHNITNINEVKNGDKVAIPNDPANGGRALKVLEAAGLIKIKDNAPDNPTVNDIENPLNLEIIEVDAGSLYSLLPDVACAVINCNYALDFGLNPGADYIFRDDPKNYDNNMYINLIASRAEDKDNEIYKRVVEAYQSAEVEKVYAEDFKGAYIPAWK